jgi:hypothetical protein
MELSLTNRGELRQGTFTAGITALGKSLTDFGFIAESATATRLNHSLTIGGHSCGMPTPKPKTLEQILDAIRKADAQERMQSSRDCELLQAKDAHDKGGGFTPLQRKP